VGEGGSHKKGVLGSVLDVQVIDLIV
jgi:hypothetical protein